MNTPLTTILVWIFIVIGIITIFVYIVFVYILYKSKIAKADKIIQQFCHRMAKDLYKNHEK